MARAISVWFNLCFPVLCTQMVSDGYVTVKVEIVFNPVTTLSASNLRTELTTLATK